MRRKKMWLGGAIPAIALAGAFTATHVAPASAVDTRTWAIDANTQVARDIQEDGWLSDGDEFYIAVIGFRTTPGRAGSTRAVFRGGLKEIDDIDKGESHTIPDSMGRMEFPSVTRRSASQILAGQSPELIGTIHVLFESDATPFSAVNSKMTSLASTVQRELARVIEPLSMTDLANPQRIADQLNTATKRIKNSTKVSVAEGIKLWLQSWTDPDDLIGVQISLFAAVDESLTGLIDSQLSGALPAGTGTAGSLRTRNYTQTYANDGLTYDIKLRVS